MVRMREAFNKPAAADKLDLKEWQRDLVSLDGASGNAVSGSVGRPHTAPALAQGTVPVGPAWCVGRGWSSRPRGRR